jgi:hypothetical protein
VTYDAWVPTKRTPAKPKAKKRTRELTWDDLAAIGMLARDATDAAAQAGDARDYGKNELADAFEADRRVAIAQIYKILRVERS